MHKRREREDERLKKKNFFPSDSTHSYLFKFFDIFSKGLYLIFGEHFIPFVSLLRHLFRLDFGYDWTRFRASIHTDIYAHKVRKMDVFGTFPVAPQHKLPHDLFGLFCDCVLDRFVGVLQKIEEIKCENSKKKVFVLIIASLLHKCRADVSPTAINDDGSDS